MKKLIFSLSLFLSFSSLVHAQWTNNGAVTFTTNSIGIGTPTPDEKLVVNGNIKTLLEATNYPAKNVATIKQLGFSGPTGAQNWTIRGVYQYPNGVLGNADGGDLDIIKSLNGNTILGTKTDGTPLGNVGIGTTNPQTSLHIVTTGATYEADNSKAISGGGLVIQGNIGGSRSAATGAQLEFVLPANPDGSNFWGQARIITVPGTSSPGAVGKMILGTRRNINKFGAGYQNYYGDDITIDGIGNVGIGMINPQNKLDVNGAVHARSVLVNLNGWPDYVFKKDYQLPSLSEVKVYIDQNQHLPEIPSEQQIAKEGLNLGEMNKLLMKKVEELTLYLIEKDKEKKEQQQINEDLKKQLKDQQIRLDELSRLLKSSSH